LHFGTRPDLLHDYLRTFAQNDVIDAELQRGGNRDGAAAAAEFVASKFYAIRRRTQRLRNPD
jgi:hypothetical protein